jgi:HEAT repeats
MSALLLLSLSLCRTPGPESPETTTPGVRLTVAARTSPGWRCDGLDENLATVRMRVWLEWLKRRRPRSLADYVAGDVDRLRSTPISNETYTDEVQQGIWKKWTHPVVVSVGLCAEATRPPESRDNCLTAPAEMTITASSGSWVVDNTAIESIVWSGQRLIPEGCPRNNYRLDFVFSPVWEHGAVVSRAVAALEDSDPSIRVLAAEALGAMGGEALGAIEALDGCLEDREPSVRRAAKAAKDKIQGSR